MIPGPITVLLRLTLATATLAGPASTTPVHPPPPPGYGLGLQQQPYPCATVLGHTGGGLGFSTDAETTPAGNRQTVVFANAEGFPEAAYQHFGHAAQLAYC